MPYCTCSSFQVASLFLQHTNGSSAHVGSRCHRTFDTTAFSNIMLGKEKKRTKGKIGISKLIATTGQSTSATCVTVCSIACDKRAHVCSPTIDAGNTSNAACEYVSSCFVRTLHKISSNQSSPASLMTTALFGRSCLSVLLPSICCTRSIPSSTCITCSR